MTKQNPRPRKYASDAERQAAYRSRAAEVCVRLEPKTMATLDSIADELGYTRNELMQSMVKFGLTNRDWRNEGLTAHKRLPRYQENPMATKPPTPAQLAARARFAEMARSGVLNRKRQIAAKRKSNPAVEKIPGTRAVGTRLANAEIHGVEVIQDISGLSKADAAKVLAVFIKEKAAKLNTGIGRTDFKHGAFLDKGVMLRALDAYNTDPKYTRKRNPAKKTVSQKISQLVHEGYPQKQAVAVALNEQRAGKIKRNPAKATMIHGYAVIWKDEQKSTWHTVALTKSKYDATEIAQLLADANKQPYAVQPRFVHEKDFEVY